MIYYTYFFCLFFFFSKMYNTSEVQKKFFLLFSLTSLFLIFGSRYYIGGDYYGYMNLYNKVAIHGFHYGYKQVEFLYFTILILCTKLGLGYFSVNFLLMFIFLFFYNDYINKFKNPFFVLLISLPIIFVPISINFVRQAIAISIFLFSIQYLVSGRYIKYLFYILLATMFHKFAILYSLFYFVYLKNFNKIIKHLLFVIFFISTFLFFSFIFEIKFITTILVDKFYWSLQVYTTEMYKESPKGGYFRLGMIFLSFFILTYFRDFFKKYDEYKLWYSAGLLMIFLTPAFFIYPFLMSRIIIFVFPIVIFVFGNVIHCNRYKKILNINIISLFFVIYFFIWLNFSPFKRFFTPYESIFFL
jgi:hypothetical protein